MRAVVLTPGRKGVREEERVGLMVEEVPASRLGFTGSLGNEQVERKKEGRTREYEQKA